MYFAKIALVNAKYVVIQAPISPIYLHPGIYQAKSITK